MRYTVFPDRENDGGNARAGGPRSHGRHPRRGAGLPATVDADEIRIWAGDLPGLSAAALVRRASCRGVV